MAMPTGEIQADLRKRFATIFGELLDLGGVYAHQVGAHIASEFLWVTSC